jgi:RNA polymerase sigma-70 factor (ECF subfamily)
MIPAEGASGATPDATEMQEDRYGDAGAWNQAEERRRLDKARENIAEYKWFYEQHGHDIRRFLASLVHDQDVADDLASETFAKGMKRLRNYEWRGVPYAAFLRRIAANEAVSYWRRKSRRPAVELQDVTIADPGPDALEMLEFSEQVALALLEVEMLGDRDRQVIEMHHLNGMGVAEIAAVLQQPEGTVQARLMRARRKVQLRLDERNRARAPDNADSSDWSQRTGT